MNGLPARAYGAVCARLLGLVLVASALLSLLAGCGLRAGGDELAFLRDGQLWTVHADGTQPVLLASGHVVSFAWSPDHHELVFRVASGAATVPPTEGRATPAAPGNIGVVSINGGAALQLTPSSSLARGDAWWNASGNRILYTETAAPPPQPPTYVVSQVDQPVGIARHVLLNVAGLPVLAPDGKRVAAVAPDGGLLLGMPGQTGTQIASGVLLTLPGGVRPARVLWQPGHDALLYALPAPAGVRLILHSLVAAGSVRTVATLPSVLDYAFSPDGSTLLVREPTQFSLWSLNQASEPLWSWPEADPLALPSWSPDGRLMLVRDRDGQQLVDLRARTARALLVYNHAQTGGPPDGRTEWHPAAESPWSADGHAVLFASSAGATWLGAPLPPARSGVTGLYVAPVSGAAPGKPTLVDSGDDRAPSWSFVDPSAAFLVASA